MGIYIQLEIMPDYISAEEWANVYLESLELLNNYPGKMMGIIWKQMGPIDEMPVYSRTLEHYIENPEKRHWHVLGDFASQKKGESFMMHYDLSYYSQRCYGKRQTSKQAEEGQTEDIFSHALEDDAVYVFNDKTQGYPYHIPMLAVAMLVESRFPKYALVSGNINLAQAKKAREWVQTVLKHDLALPVSVQGKALYRRLVRFYQGDDLIKTFTRLFRGSSEEEYEAIFELGDKAVIKHWFLRELKHYRSPDQIGVTGLFINWLNKTGDLKTLSEMACLDEKGPKFDPVKFASGLAATWLTIDQSEFNFFDMFSPGDIESVDSQFGQFFLDAGFKGRQIRRHISLDTVISVLSNLFPKHIDQIEQALRNKTDKIKKDLGKIKEPAQEFIHKLESEPEKLRTGGRIDDLIRFNPQQPLSDLQDIALRGLAYGIRESQKKIYQMGKEGAELYEGSSAQLKERLVMACYEKIVLTEDAWAWISREEDKELLRFLLTLMMIGSNEQTFSIIRRAVFEKRELCQKIVQMSHDKQGLSDLKKLLDEEDLDKEA